ncbi:MAG: 2-phospho-L-lactate guanylyltransferase [Candidatus Argoarchaeum ethanivorans]|uniref:2-phospho-L-lactate guanylyltransferase n=1 Tax=Candidatus Argoarchaeum ethanivorans TaxID=2608793 RepID=A0A812A1P7_9EURY|nr:MAG: 2-phospho-L-lactate guanylyltransferase [Candidatus Argoarchaeum ethanivorans]
MRAVIPFKKQNCKTRLSSVLSLQEREQLAYTMLTDVVATLNRCNVEVDILSTGVKQLDVDANVIYSDISLNNVLNEYLSGMASHHKHPPSTLIVMSDVPLLTAEHITHINNRDEDLVIAPGKGGGTNVLYIRNPASFYVDYYGTSFLDHTRIARKRNLTVYMYDSFYLSCDMDEPSDLIELLVHGTGSAAQLLKKWGFYVLKDGVVGLYRKYPPPASPSE